jgi:spore germination protein YaaH
MVDTKIPAGVNATWDEATKQNYIEWKSNGVTYKEWIEDKDSISAKLDLVKKYNLAGAGFWEKDRETQDVWDVIDEKLNQ